MAISRLGRRLIALFGGMEGNSLEGRKAIFLISKQHFSSLIYFNVIKAGHRHHRSPMGSWGSHDRPRSKFGDSVAIWSFAEK